ncbi:MAG: hypothetical protein IPH29_14595 [Candidatus Microthrix sp.]|nr:hypothetical protein [Candidatus Microthrix sp.]
MGLIEFAPATVSPFGNPIAVDRVGIGGVGVDLLGGFGRRAGVVVTDVVVSDGVVFGVGRGAVVLCVPDVGVDVEVDAGVVFGSDRWVGLLCVPDVGVGLGSV